MKSVSLYVRAWRTIGPFNESVFEEILYTTDADVSQFVELLHRGLECRFGTSLKMYVTDDECNVYVSNL